MKQESEIFHLTKAWLAVSFMFSVLFDREALLSFDLLSYSKNLLIAGVIVGLSFVLHELAHRYVARKFKLWAEFRSNDKMLLLGILMSFAGFILIAPGAVFIKGHISKRENGLISMAGPSVNIILAFISLALTFVIPNTLTSYSFIINSWLGIFNLIPAFGFDGKKIFDWDKKVYVTMAGLALILLLIVF